MVYGLSMQFDISLLTAFPDNMIYTSRVINIGSLYVSCEANTMHGHSLDFHKGQPGKSGDTKII